MPRRRSRTDGQTGRRSVLAAAATGIAGIGLGVNVLKPAAYTSAVTGRGANAQVADDPNAVLGLEGLSDTSVTPTFTNQSDSAMDVKLDAVESGIEWDVGDDGNYETDPVEFPLSSGAFTDVAVKGADEVTVDITAVLTSGGTETGRIELRRTIDVPASNNLALSGTVSSNGNSGDFNFTLENTGDVDVELRKIGVIETTTTAEYVSAGGSFYNVDVNPSTELVSDRIPIDNSTSNSTLKPMSPKPVLDHQADNDGTPNEIAFKLEKFQTPTANPSNTDMRGEDVKIELTVKNLENGNVVTAPISLCSGSCDF